MRYYDNLLELNTSHSELYTEFRNGCFSIKRTKISFSRTPTDLTIEQTINKDAACQSTGILAITNSIAARQRRSESYFIRTNIISNLFEDLGMASKDDTSKDLRPSVLRKNSTDLQKIISLIEKVVNPFSETISLDTLYNIASGEAASKETSDFLLNIKSIGSKEQDTFIQECIEDLIRFGHKRIKRQICRHLARREGSSIRQETKSLWR